MTEPTLSPDGLYSVIFKSTEMKMSHWLDCPIVVEIQTGRILLDLSESLWSADLVWWSDDRRMVSLKIRRYPGNAPGIAVDFDPALLLARLYTPGFEKTVPAGQVLDELELYYSEKMSNSR